MSTNSFDVIAVSETWLNESIPDNSVSLPGYVIIRHDRKNLKKKGGGGVCLYVSTDISYLIVDSSSDTDTEYLIVKLTVANTVLLVCVVYRPPLTPLPESFADAYSKIAHCFENVVVLGDFNCDMLKDTAESRFVYNFLTTFSLYMPNVLPTHHTLHLNSHTLLDLCFVDSRKKLLDFHQSGYPFLSAHEIIFLTYDIRKPLHELRTVQYRDFKNLNCDTLMVSLQRYLSLSPMNYDDLNNSVANLNDIIHKAFDECVPIKTLVLKNPPAPWMTPQIKSEIDYKNKLRNYFKSFRTPYFHTLYKNQLKIVNEMIHDSKSEFYTNKLSALQRKNNSRLLWRELRSLGVVDSSKQDQSLPVSSDDINEYFIDSVKQLTTSLTLLNNPVQFIEPALPENGSIFDFSPITLDELVKLLSVSSTNAEGVDGIPARYLTLSMHALAPVILEIINRSLTTSTFPDLWKKALIIPLPKVNKPSCPKDYRPISILCSLSKILETVVYRQLITFLNISHSLDDKQSGFKRGYSTQTVLLRLVDDVRAAMDNRLVTVLVLFDFSKAFDLVDHDLLFLKLRQKGCSDQVVNWFRSYLSGRQQAVKDPNGNISSWLNVETGVAQGSVLGPMTFSVFLDNLPKILKFCLYLLYADDLQIYLHGPVSEINELLSQVNSDIQAVFNWSTANKLYFNSAKTKIIILGTRNQLNSIDYSTLPQIKIGDTTIPYVRSATNLGVLMDETLSWSSHVSQTVRRVWFTLRQIRHSKSILSVDLRRQLVLSLIVPIFDYCCLLLTNLTMSDEKKLQTAFNSCVRFIFGLRRGTSVSPYFTRLGWLRIVARRRYFLCCLTYKLLSNKSPSYLANHFIERSEIVQRFVRRRYRELVVPFSLTNAMYKSFIVNATTSWNSLPDIIKRATSFSMFKSSVHKHLFENQCSEIMFV